MTGYEIPFLFTPTCKPAPLKGEDLNFGSVMQRLNGNFQSRGMQYAVNGFKPRLRIITQCLVQGFAMDTMEAGEVVAAVPGEVEVLAFLDRIKQAEITRHTAVDLGLDVRLSGDQLVGGALIADDRIIHLSSFNLPEKMQERGRDHVNA